MIVLEASRKCGDGRLNLTAVNAKFKSKSEQIL